MFRSGFAEGTETDILSGDIDSALPDDANASTTTGGKDDDGSVGCSIRFEDSDDEDDDEDPVLPDHQIQLRLPDTHKRSRASRPSSRASADQAVANDEDESEGRNVKVKLSHPSSPRDEANVVEGLLIDSVTEVTVPGPKKTKVVVKDVAYSTYRAVLNYVSCPVTWRILYSKRLQIYTDTIVFAPLASTFHVHHLQADMSETNTPVYGNSRGHVGNSLSLSTPAATATEGPTFPPKAPASGEVSASASPPLSRRAWIAEWEKNNPKRPCPCSAKAVYRLADSKDELFLHTKTSN